eukprot:6643007-Pyramimonas_sp.AAC.1
MKNNMPLLLGLAEHTTRVRWKSFQSTVLQQKPNMHADECRRFCQEVTNSFSHTRNAFYHAKTGGKLDAHVKLPGEAMGLKFGTDSPST